MLTIFYEWKNSLTLFKKDTFLLLLYSWYKLSKQLYKFSIYYFLALFFLWSIIAFIQFFGFLYFPSYNFQVINTIIFFKATFIVFQYIIILLARPTLENKDIHYIMTKGIKYIPSIILTTFLYGASKSLAALLFLLPYMVFLHLNGQFFLPWYLFFLKTHSNTIFFLWIWTTLFLLDFKPSIKNCFKAIWLSYKMALLNVPIAFFLWGFLISFYKMLSLIETYFSPVEKDLMHVFFYPIIIALITTIYIKRAHDQCSFYTGRRNA